MTLGYVDLSEFIEVNAEVHITELFECLIENKKHLSRTELNTLKDIFFGGNDGNFTEDVRFAWSEILRKLEKEDLIKLCVKLLDGTCLDLNHNGDIKC